MIQMMLTSAKAVHDVPVHLLIDISGVLTGSC